MIKNIIAIIFLMVFSSSCAMFSKGGAGAGGESAAIVPGSQADLEANVGDRVFFTFDRSDLTSEAKEVLARQATWLQHYPHLPVTIEGHCDERGTREYNLSLGERRGNSVKSYLASLGIAADRITVVSYGKEKPAVIGSDEDAFKQNRRGVTIVGGAAPAEAGK